MSPHLTRPASPHDRAPCRRVLGLWIAALTTVAAGACDTSDELESPDLPMSLEVRPPPPYNVRIRAVLLANDDGSNATDAQLFTGAFLSARVAEVNAVWAPSGLNFEFDPATDMEWRNSTLLNNDCTIFETGSGVTCDKQPNTEERERVALDAAHDGKITVYFRYGGETITCSRPNSHCTVDKATKASSGHQGHYVLIRNTALGNNGLAHELGHYFWNYHPYGAPAAGGTVPVAVANAQQAVLDYVAHGASEDDGALVFDGDRGYVSDTPPDPGIGFWSMVKGNGGCGTGVSDSTYSLPVTFPNGDTRSYTLAPDRTNIMSYYFGCAGLVQTSTPEQQARARDAVTVKNRKQLIGLAPTDVQFESTGFSPGWPSGVTAVVPFTLDRRPHVLLYGPTNARIERILDDRTDSVTVYAQTWTSGWTSLVPFSLGGAPHLLLYKTGTGAAVIYKLTADLAGNVSLVHLWNGSLGTGLTSLEPFVLDGQPHLYAYKGSDGTLDIDRVRPNGLGVDVMSSSHVEPGYTSLMPFVLGGEQHVLSYGATSGLVRIDHVPSTAQLDHRWSSTWTKGWTSFAPFNRGAQPRYVAYKTGTGEVDVDAVKSNGLGVTPLVPASWGAGLKLVPVRMIGHWYTLAYNPVTGAAGFYLMVQ